MLPLPGIKDQEAARMVTDDAGFFGIRLESIGGYGAHIAGRILAEAGILHVGLNGSNFSSYGSEKKGTPVKAFIRFCPRHQELRTSAPVEQPHLVGIFHEALVYSQPVLSGLRPGGTAILNSRKTPAEARTLLQWNDGVIGVIDALGIAIAEGSRANMVMLGAICRALPFLDPEAVRAIIRETFGKKYPRSIPGNLRAFDRGYAEVRFEEAAADPGTRRQPLERPGPLLGYLDAPIGGVIVNPGNSVLKDLSASRQGHLPEFIREQCIDCTQCDLVCPDMCFVWTMGADTRGNPALVLQGIDYQYCKGCMRCVEACPTRALVERREEAGWAAQHRVPQQFAPVR